MSIAPSSRAANTRRHARFQLSGLCTATALALTACGGGGDSPDKPAGKETAQVTSASPPAVAATPEFNDYIVVFKATVADPPALAARLAAGHGGQVKFTYSNVLKGFAVRLPAAAASGFLAAMARHPDVDYVEVDGEVRAFQTTQNNATWGLDRVDQHDLPLSGTYSYDASGAGVTGYVVDTGILATHTDIRGRVAKGYTVISDGKGTGDCNGHGTHVSGTIGGTTWGIAKGVTLVPVRVLNCAGSGSLSGVIAGLNWILSDDNKNSKRPAVVNMSLGGGFAQSLNDAVENMVNHSDATKSLTVVVAAGNDNADACKYSPASAPSALTVGATTSTDARAGYSNFGKCLDLFAPGSSITSAWRTSNTATKTLSGTSMAAPHVAGLVAQILQREPAVLPAQVDCAVKSSATTDKVTSPGTGSSNRLLYTYTGSATGCVLSAP